MQKGKVTTMSKSLKQSVLAIAKKNEAERLKNAKEKILGLVQGLYDKALEVKGYEFHVEPLKIPIRDVEDSSDDTNYVQQAISDLGYEFRTESIYGTYGTPTHYVLYVPGCVKGQKKTPAQLQCYKFEAECKKRARAEEQERNRIAQEHRDHARLACEEVLERLKKGEVQGELMKHTKSSLRQTIMALRGMKPHS